MSAELGQLAPLVALLGVMVDTNEPPDMSNLDSKPQLFKEVQRLELTVLLKLLCMRMGVNDVTVKRGSKAFDALMEALAGVYGWTFAKGKDSPSLFIDRNQAQKMVTWVETASFDKGVVTGLARDLLNRVSKVRNVQEKPQDAPADFAAADAVATMTGVKLVQPAAPATESEAERRRARRRQWQRRWRARARRRRLRARRKRRRTRR